MKNENIIKKLNSINDNLRELDEYLLSCVKEDNEQTIKRQEILKSLSSIYLNTQLCAQHLKYIKMKDCRHIFVKRYMLSCKAPVSYCICCGLNNFYECIDSNNYIINEEDKILKSCYENTQNNGIFLTESIISPDELENISSLYQKLNNQSLSREEIISKLKQNTKKMTKK